MSSSRKNKAGTATAPSRDRRHRRGQRTLGCTLTLIAAILAGTGLMLAMEAFRGQRAYLELAATVTDRGADGDEAASVDWQALWDVNPETVAWLIVQGTAIDYPVVQPAGETEGDWYLSHDFWGSASSAGCPYLDARAAATGTHLLVFGHHLSLSDQMFSEIFQAFRQEVFDGVGTATWITPEDGAVTFEPTMALTVDQAYEPIQTFSFTDETELRTWLTALLAEAGAVSSDARELIAGATRVLTLVTCSSMRSGQRARTLLIFTA